MRKRIQVNIYEAKTQLSKLVDKAAAGQEVIIARAGKPIAKLVPVEQKKAGLRWGLMKGKFKVPDDFDAPLPDDVLKLFEGD